MFKTVKSRLILLLTIAGLGFAYYAYAHTNTTTISRSQIAHPDLGYEGGSALHTAISAMWTKVGDDSNSRYFRSFGTAVSTTTAHVHTFGVPFDDLSILLYLGSPESDLTRVFDPTSEGWTIAATAGLEKTSIDVTTPGSGGPFDYSLVVVHGGSSDAGAAASSGTGTNVISNPGSESILSNWTNGGGGTLVSTTTAADVAVGSRAFEWDASAASDTFTSDAFTMADDKTLHSRLCLLSGWYKGGDANLTLQVWDGSAAIASKVLSAAGAYSPTGDITFLCPSTGTIAIRVIASADSALVNFDEFFLGTRDTAQAVRNSGYDSFTPVGVLTNVSNTINDSKIRYHGNFADIRIRVDMTGVATSTIFFDANDYFPTGTTVNATDLISVRTTCGTVLADDDSAAATADQFGGITSISSTGGIVFISDNQDVWDATAPFAWANSDALSFECNNIPINEGGSVDTLVQDNLIDERDYPGVWSTAGGGEDVDSSILKTTYSKVGEHLLINWSVKFDTTGSLAFGSGAFEFSIPSGLVPNVSKMGKIQSTAGFYYARGSGFMLDNSASNAETTRMVVVSGWDDNAKKIILYGDGFAPVTNSTFAWLEGDTISFDARIPIVGWEGSQRSLVGFTEATSSNVGLVKKNRTQRKVLVAQETATVTDIATNGDGANNDFHFTGLTIGERYRLNVHARLDNTGTSTDLVQLNARHNGVNILSLTHRKSSTNNSRLTSGGQVTFTALTTSITFDLSLTTTGSIQPDAGGSFIELEELKNTEPTTAW